jgi:hypothetical protein
MPKLIQIGTRIINLDRVTHVTIGFVTVLSGGQKKKKVKEVKIYFGKDSITFTDVEADTLLKTLQSEMDIEH